MRTALAAMRARAVLFSSSRLLCQSARSTNLLGALEHADQLLLRRGLPVVRNGRQAPLFPFGLEGEPPLRPLLSEWHAEFSILMQATVGDRTGLSTFTPAFRAFGND